MKLTALINDIKLCLASKQSNLNFDPSFVGIHQVLREIWLFEHEFQATNCGQLRIFGGIKFVKELFIKLVSSIRIST